MDRINARIAGELLAHEGIVREAYRDSVGVWTWSVGITDASGHHVGRYRDNPQSLEHCLAVFLWALRTRYLPQVLAAFPGQDLAEHQLAAALSFHWNTGAVARAEWVRLFRRGDVGRAREAMLNWCKPRSLLKRRRAEQALFFDGRWAGNGSALVYDVAKPSYRPTRGRRVVVGDVLARMLGESPAPVVAIPEPEAPPSARRNWFERLFA